MAYIFAFFQASRVLNLERNSLEFLLQHFCGVTANKECVLVQSVFFFVFTLILSLVCQLVHRCRYQNADWRIRPLPKEMTRLILFCPVSFHYCSGISFLLAHLFLEFRADMQEKIPTIFCTYMT